MQDRIYVVTSLNPVTFAQSPLSLFRVHWYHERTPNPSREGN